jgi:hypothetical protein
MSSGYAVEAECEPLVAQKKSSKKPGFIKRWLLKVAEEAWNQKREKEIYSNSIDSVKTARLSSNSLSLGSQSIDQPERAIRFNVYNATGGRIIEVARYDKHRDRHVNGLYIVTNDQDFGREIDKIIVQEFLK